MSLHNSEIALFLGFLIFNSKQDKTREEQKQSREIGTEGLPFPVASKSPATAPEKLMAWSWREHKSFQKYFLSPRQRRQKSVWWLRVGEPQEEGYDIDSSSFPLNNLPKV